MLNLVEKFTPEAVEATDEDGVVAIEYVVMAGVLVVGLGALRGPALRTALTAKLHDARRRHLIRSDWGEGQRPPPRIRTASP